jgi:hypothetical protein
MKKAVVIVNKAQQKVMTRIVTGCFTIITRMNEWATFLIFSERFNNSTAYERKLSI